MISPDLSLSVKIWRERGAVALHFELSSRENLEGARGDSYGPWPLQDEPHTVLERQLHDLQNLTLDCRQDPTKVQRRLRAKGAWLFEKLLPKDLRDVLWSLRPRVETFVIVSEVLGIPWELLRFHGRSDDPEAEGPFFSEAFALSRGLPGGGLSQPRFGHLHDLALIVHQGDDFEAERSELGKLLESHIEVARIEPTSAGIEQALGSGRFDAFHFAGHGSAAGEDPGSWTLSVDEDESLSLEEVAAAIRGFERSRPLVFLNACETGRVGLALLGLEGWVSRFLAAGASLFVGTLWEVPGDRAFCFADAFYRRFLRGMPFGEAVRRARSDLRDHFPEDPTWLAFVTYGHPMSQISEKAPGLREAGAGTEPSTMGRQPSSGGQTQEIRNKEPEKGSFNASIDGKGFVIGHGSSVKDVNF